MNLYELAADISKMAPGQRWEVSRQILDQIAPTAPLVGGYVWTPPERVMENIIGSAYEFRFWENYGSGYRRVIFERLKKPLQNGSRTYVSPDRREHFRRDDDGYYWPNAVARSIKSNAEVSEGGTRDSRIETAAQSRPSLH